MSPDDSVASDADIESPAKARRLALEIEYEGTNYAGFQLQAREPTIQGELEKALYRLTRENIRVRGASRTDSGAHALGQVVDFEAKSTYTSDTFVGALNYYLPDDIRVLRASEVDGNFNARRDAVSRTYRYRILNRSRPSALWRRDSHWISEPLNVEYMNLAAKDLLGVHDFRAFAPAHPADRSTVRRVDRWEVAHGRDDTDFVNIVCEASGFMQHQIRRTNAVLAAIGKASLPVGAIREILEGLENSTSVDSIGAIPTLPAKGLCLVKVKYRKPW
ncbi:MAG: tRNA pseudouridine(38-40) synthase TruA [Chloroflexota bacterium]|nr:tRNA pseudouridine(38-40) synthase TruA [Chloroflexota bacterium]